MALTPDRPIVFPEAVLALASRIESEGGQLFVVGGWVRDLLRGKECKDIDLATDLPPARVRRAIESSGPVYDIGERFGTICTIADGFTFEITTLRTDAYSEGSRHPEVTHIDQIEDDLGRRDFTINAMALRVSMVSENLIDPFGGAADLASGVIRTPGDPEPRMAEDPLRMMRAVRFAAQLGFRIEDHLLDVLKAQADRLDQISWERRRDELEKTIVSPHPDVGVRLLVDTGLMSYVSEEVAAMKGVAQPSAYHRADVLEHTLLTMTYLAPDPLLRRAALFHDVGKPPTRITEPRLMFNEHDKVGTELTQVAMRRLRYSTEDIQATVFMVRRHMRPIRYERDWSDSAVRRLVRDCNLRRNGEVVVPMEWVFELARADVKAGNLDKAPIFGTLIDDLEDRIEELGAHEEIHLAASPLDGTELAEMFAREPGPWLKPLKGHLKQLVIEGRLKGDDKEAAARFAREFMDGNGF